MVKTNTRQLEEAKVSFQREIKEVSRQLKDVSEELAISRNTNNKLREEMMKNVEAQAQRSFREVTLIVKDEQGRALSAQTWAMREDGDSLDIRVCGDVVETQRQVGKVEGATA